MTRPAPWLLFARENAVAILIVLAILGTLAFVSTSSWKHQENAGFGPEWECTPMSQGDPVCVKKPAVDAKQEKTK